MLLKISPHAHFMLIKYMYYTIYSHLVCFHSILCVVCYFAETGIQICLCVLESSLDEKCQLKNMI